jgi:hypothetical protein
MRFFGERAGDGRPAIRPEASLPELRAEEKRKLRVRDFEEAEELFEEAMRKFRTRAGGHLFYNLVRPYAITCLRESRVDLAKDAIEHLERKFDACPGSMPDQGAKVLVEGVSGK